jgi:flagellar biosynthesis/type III secretory pathway protein FliH
VNGQYVAYTFYRVDPAWRRLPVEEREAAKEAFEERKSADANAEDHAMTRAAAEAFGLAGQVRRGIESGERLGRHRWVVERTLAWFARFRRLTVRYERRADILLGLHLLAAGLICLRLVERWSC